MKILPLAVLISLIPISGAMAQMSVTTIGATDATACYENASTDLSTDVDPCDTALRDGNLTRKDKIKTLVNRGIIHNRNQDLDDAVSDFNEALSMDEDLAEAYLNRGNSHFLSGDYAGALDDYETALSLGVRKPWAAWYNIGLVYDAMDDKANAREAYEHALEINPDFTLAQQKLAVSD